MSQHVKRWGNSLAVRIPSGLAEALGLRDNDPVEMHAEDGRLIIERKRWNRKKLDLDELLSRVTDDNIHPETDWGPPVGKEFW